MTKYILHGGETGIPNENNKAFYQSWVKDFKQDFIPNILLVYFARVDSEWPGLEKQDRERFTNYTNNRQADFHLADKDIGQLRQQIKNADIVYVRGGSSDSLLELFRPLENELVELLDGKIYAGSSAGVMVMSNYTCSTSKYWRKGLGILPLNTFVHWSPQLQQELDSFRNSHDDGGFEWLLIPETEFVIRSY